jgi:hypothetical protein
MSSALSFEDGTDIGQDLQILTKQDIISAGSPHIFGRADCRTRDHLLMLVSRLAVPDQNRIRALASAKRKFTLGDKGNPEEFVVKRKKQQHETPIKSAEYIESEFLKAQTVDVVEGCIAKFIDRTGNDALATTICVACAREVQRVEATMMSIGSLPHQELLQPFEQHPAHILTNGMLLHSLAISASMRGSEGSICHECLSSLRKGRVPRLALANGMWVGDVPFELTVLTLPERILIGRHFPAAHIVKLFPMQKGATSSNSGLRGNVSTYRLDMDEIVDMIDGNLMPHTSKILASTIGVTLVGPKNIPEKSLPGFLWVRRHRVRSTLVWLKANNPFFSNIIISEQRLSELAENGIPHEILGAMQFSDNVEEVDRERAGYVPEDEELVGPEEISPQATVGGKPVREGVTDAIT